MAEPWLKLDTSLTSNPKVMRLSSEVFKFWICMLCEVKLFNEGGRLPPLPRLAFSLHISLGLTAKMLDALCEAGLVDDDGDELTVHDWEDWQRPVPSETREAWVERQRRSRESRKSQAAANGHDVSRLSRVSRMSRPQTRLEETREEKTREEGETPPLSPSGGSALRGTRIPPDFDLDDSDLAYARDHGISEEAARRHLEGFRLHFEQATRNATSNAWHKRWKLRLLASVDEGRLRRDLLDRREDSPEEVVQLTPAEAGYQELNRVLREGEEAEGDVFEVSMHLGGIDTLRAEGVPSYSDWVAAWNSAHPSG